MKRLTSLRFAVVALGEIAQSPRMMNHARALLDEGAAVELVGYIRLPLPDDLTGVPNLTVRSVSRLAAHRWASLPRMVFVIAAMARSAWISVRLAIVLIQIGRVHGYIVQNPPALPALLITWLTARRYRARLIIDWHNMTFAMLSARLGSGHPLVRVIEYVEGVLARRANGHWCVSDALRGDLASRWSITADVVRDRPRVHIPHCPENERYDVLREVADAVGNSFNPAAAAGAVLIVSPTSWSSEEDMPLLARGLARFSRSGEAPPIVVFATGVGPHRGAFEQHARTLQSVQLSIVTGWLPDALYRRLLSVADLGISVHRSTSGLDLPMKIVDMLAAGIPPLVFDYGPCLNELLTAATSAGSFSDADGLAERLRTLLADYPSLTRLRRIRAAIGTALPAWKDEWERAALPGVLP
jgi:beta-1,4-mannosyltransferase